MTFQEIFTYGTTSVATIAAVVAAIYGVVGYHRPKGAATANAKRSAMPPSRSIVPIVAAMIAWLAIIAGFINQHWFLPKVETEISLSAENARLDLTPQPFWKDADKSLYMNFRIANGGKSTALNSYRWYLVTLAPGNLDPDLIDAYFIMARAKLKKTPSIGTNEMHPGSSDQFFSVPDTPNGLLFGSDDNYQAAKNGTLPMVAFMFVLQRYRDQTLPVDRFIYTERCVYVAAAVVHSCEQGHNRSYIAD